MRRGAYGLRLVGDAPDSSLLVSVSPDAPEIRIERRAGTVEVDNVVSTDSATVPLLGGGGLALQRLPATATITTPRPISDDELAHPYLAPIAAVHSHWLGRAAFHAGGIVVGDSVWGVIGEREAGKSTLLAAVHRIGGGIVADDLLVTEGETVFAGPRTLDLRQGAAEWLGQTRSLGVAGARERWRLDLDPVESPLRLAGWVVPSWGTRIEVIPNGGAAAAHHLAGARSVTGLRISPRAFMAAAARPTVEMVRPRDFSQLEAGAHQLLAALTAHS